MSAPHDEQALAAAYVLGALDAAERQRFEAHLAACPVCSEEVRSLGGVVAALGRSVPQIAPDPALRSRVLRAVTGTAPAPAAPPRSAIAWLPFAASLLVAIGLGGYARQLQGRVGLLETRVDSAERRAAAAERGVVEARRVADEAQTAMAVLQAPDLVRVDLSGQQAAPQATARALWSRNRGMVFLTTNLPAAPPDRVYQVWVLANGARISAGLLTPDNAGRGMAFFRTPADIPTPSGVAVSLEPAGGVTQPTGDIYLAGSPAP